MSNEITEKDLIERAQIFCAAKGISLSRLSTIVVNDGKFFTRLQEGGTCSLRQYNKFILHFNEHKQTAA